MIRRCHFSGVDSVLTEILSQSSHRITKSRISGVANKESSHVLCMTIVFCKSGAIKRIDNLKNVDSNNTMSIASIL